MKIHIETSHEIKFRAAPENGDSYQASVFIKPFITIDCSALWEGLKERLNIQEQQDQPPSGDSTND